MSNACIWSKLRETYLDLKDTGVNGLDVALPHFKILMRQFAPTSVPNPSEGGWGDQGTVNFADGSYIKWDWDNGDFEFEETRLSYPWSESDPLFWSDEDYLDFVDFNTKPNGQYIAVGIWARICDVKDGEATYVNDKPSLSDALSLETLPEY